MFFTLWRSVPHVWGLWFRIKPSISYEAAARVGKWSPKSNGTSRLYGNYHLLTTSECCLISWWFCLGREESQSLLSGGSSQTCYLNELQFQVGNFLFSFHFRENKLTEKETDQDHIGREIHKPKYVCYQCQNLGLIGILNIPLPLVLWLGALSFALLI